MRDVRKNLDLTGGDFAKRINTLTGRKLSHVQVSRWENYSAIPSGDVLLAALSMIGISIDSIIGTGSGTPGVSEMEDLKRRMAAMERELEGRRQP